VATPQITRVRHPIYMYLRALLVASCCIGTVLGQARWAIQGAVGANGYKNMAQCAQPTSLHNVRCCSDRYLGGYQKKQGCSVWAESYFTSVGQGSAGCVKSVTYARAKQICAREHARLCTRAELEANCAQGTGCGHDAKLMWTADTCGTGVDQCTGYANRLAEVATECCNEPTEHCPQGLPTSCNAGCAEVLLPFQSDCVNGLANQGGQAAVQMLHQAASTCTSTAAKTSKGGGKSSKKPNILFIGTDQQRTTTLGCYGNSWAHSPNIDKLAAGGVRFTDAVTVTPVCSPSRTSVLTGVHVPIHGVYENGIVRYDHRDTLTPYFDQLKKVHYHTALIGKTHFQPTPSSIDHLDAHTGNNDKRGKAVDAASFLETYLVDETMKWISGLPDSRPWFCYTSMVSPHPPNWVPEGPWTHVYDGVKLPPINFKGGNIAELPYQTRMLLGLLGKEHDHPPAFPRGQPNMAVIDAPVGGGRAGGRYNYYTQAAYVDYQVGRLLDYLDKHQLADTTLVIFSSDHGTELYDHGIANDKHNFLDATLRVPLIMRLPNVLPKGETRRFATTLDITATILAAAQAPIPNSYQGMDLLNPLAAGKPSPRLVGIACEYRAMSVVTPSWKLAYFPETDEGRLWDRRVDPAEQHDLWHSSDASVTAARTGLLKALLRWRAQQDALGFMQHNLHGQGPTALHVIEHTMKLRGLDAELRLQQDALQFEHLRASSSGHRRRLGEPLRSPPSPRWDPARLKNMSKTELLELIIGDSHH
jgi:arylsulfatase